MTTITQLRKQAESIGFVERLKELGFEISPSGFWFYRLRDEYIDYIGFSISSSKCWVDVPVICLLKDLATHCDMEKFPKGFDKNIPFYSSTFINEEYGVEIGSDPWKIEKEEDVKESLDQIYGLIKSSADGWFKNIDSGLKLYESFTVNFRESEKAEELKKILVGS